LRYKKATAYPGSMSDRSRVELAKPSMARTLAAFRSQARMDMAFGGLVNPGASSFAITGSSGAQTAALNNLVIRSGAGLGGKALVLGRPISVMHYHGAKGITHIYDHAVRQERLETVAALPVLVDSIPRMVIYLASRAQVGLGTRWFDSFVPMLRRLERDIAVEDQVRRRLDALRPEPQTVLTHAELLDIARELADLGERVQDDKLRERLEAVSDRLVAATPRRSTPIHLSPREIDVLAQVSQGCTNQDAANNLGLLPNTVKSYLKTAMRKLQAANRVQAITAARQAGLIS